MFLWVREELQELTAEAYPQCAVNDRVDSDCLFLSAQAILDEVVPVNGDEALLTHGGVVVGFRLKVSTAQRLGSVRSLSLDLPESEVKARVIEWPWDLVEMNVPELVKEIEVRGEKLEARTRKSERILGHRPRRRGRQW